MYHVAIFIFSHSYETNVILHWTDSYVKHGMFVIQFSCLRCYLFFASINIILQNPGVLSQTLCTWHSKLNFMLALIKISANKLCMYLFCLVCLCDVIL